MLLRILDPAWCYKTGHWTNSYQVTKSGPCPSNVQLQGQTWFHARILVMTHSVSIYLNDVLIVMVAPYKPVVGRGGPCVVNAYNSTIQFRHFKIESKFFSTRFT